MVDKADTTVGENLAARMNSARYRHKDATRRLHGRVRGITAETLTSISRRRGSALTLVNPSNASHIASRTSLLQGQCRWDGYCCLDGIVWNAYTKAACNIRARLHDEITLWRRCREVKALLAERTRTAEGTAHPGLGLPARANVLPSTESESPSPVKNRAD